MDNASEIVVYLGVAVIVGGMVLLLVARFNANDVNAVVKERFTGQDVPTFTKVDADGMVPLLFKTWESCGRGSENKDIFFQYNGTPLSAQQLIAPIMKLQLCGTLGLNRCGCGARNDITFGSGPVYNCTAAALDNGKVYRATCNATTKKLNIDVTAQACSDPRDNATICNGAGVVCSVNAGVDDLCGITRRCSCAVSLNNVCCNNACVDNLTDNANCGTCGHACSVSETCQLGVCKPPPCGGPPSETCALMPAKCGCIGGNAQCCPTCTNKNLVTYCCDAPNVVCAGDCKTVTPSTTLGTSCDCDAECGVNTPAGQLSCTTGLTTPSQNFCCPAGKHWNSVTSTCDAVQLYILVTVPVEYTPGDIPTTYAARAEKVIQFSTAKLPMKETPGSFIAIRSDTLCPGATETNPQANVNLVMCANQAAVAAGYPGANMAAGLYGTCVGGDGCPTGPSNIVGYTVPGQGWFVQGNDSCILFGCPSNADAATAPHEIGHNFKLCEGYCYSSGNPSSPCYVEERTAWGSCGTATQEQKYPGTPSSCGATGPCKGRILTGDPIHSITNGRDIMGPSMDNTYSRDFACDSYLAFKAVAIADGFTLPAPTAPEINICNTHISADTTP